MTYHQDSVQVQQSAIAAIWCLVNEHPENQAAARAIGVTELIACAVQRFGGRPEGQQLKPTAAGALQVLLPGFATALTAASSVYTAPALGLRQPVSPSRSQAPLSSRSRTGSSIVVNTSSKPGATF